MNERAGERSSDVVWLKRATVDELLSRQSSLDRVVEEGDIIDLATFGKPSEMGAKRTTKLVRAPDGEYVPGGEIGSAWDRWRHYAYFENGVLYEDGPVETIDLEDMLRRDGKARAIEQAITLPLRGAQYEISPATGDKGEAEFISDALTRSPADGGMEIPFDLVIGQMTSARLYKRACFERVYTVGSDGLVRYSKLAYRPPATTYVARVAEDASFAGFMQWTWRGMDFVRILIPANKAFVYLHGQYRDPLQGVSDLEAAFTVFQSKQKLRFLWYQFLETQASPRTWAKVGGNDETQAKTLAQKVAQLRGGGVVGLLSDQEVGVIESNGTGAQQFSQALAYLDQEMADSVLAGFLQLTSQANGHSGSGQTRGSQALSQDQRDFFLSAGDAVLREMAAHIRNYAIADLVRLNFGRQAVVPNFAFDELAQNDSFKDSVALLQAISTAPTPPAVIPWEFIDLLVESVAGYLDLDTDAIHKALLTRNDPAGKTPLETLGNVAAGQAPPGAGAHALGTVIGRASSMLGGLPDGSHGVGARSAADE